MNISRCLRVLSSEWYCGIRFKVFFEDTKDRDDKGLINIYGNTGPGILQRGHWLFLSFCDRGPRVTLNVDCAGPLVISLQEFNGNKGIFEALNYGAIDLYQSYC